MKKVMDPINTPTQRFKDGDPAKGEYGTIVTAEFLNNVQDSVINTQQELHSVLSEAGIEANNEQLDQVAKAIKKIAGDATRDNFNELANPDGYKHIGRCKSVAELRTIRPTEHGQRILVDAYYEGGTTGGGEFVADLQDLITPDDGGVCFVVENNGGRWKRLFTTLHADDFGLLGDGRDETAAVQAALNAAVGKSLQFARGKRYGVQKIVVSAGAKVDGNGAEWRKLVANAAYAVVIESDVSLRHLRVTSQGSADDRAVRIVGSRVQIEGLAVESEQPGSGYGVHVEALNATETLHDVQLNEISVKNYDAALPIFNVQRASVDGLNIHGYRTGVYLKDVAESAFCRAQLAVKSPNAQGAAGQNGLLIESSLAAYACHDLHFADWVVSDAAEHSYRLGGQLGIRNVAFVNCVSKKSGNHGGTSSGGCGFKVLGATFAVSRHKNVKFIGCHVEDVNVTSGHDNFSGFLLAVVDSVVLSGCSVSKNHNRDYSCIDGIQIDGATDIVLSGNNVQDSHRQAIRCVASTYALQAGQDGIINNLNVIGGLYQHQHRNNAPVVFFDVNSSASASGRISNVCFRGVSLRGGMAAVRSKETITYHNIFMDFDYDNGLTSGATPVIPGKGDIFYHAQMPWIGYSPTAKNGSLITDTLTGTVRLRKDDKWVIL